MMTTALGKLSILAAAVGRGRAHRNKRKEDIRTKEYRRRGGMDITRHDNHLREIKSSVTFVNRVIDQTEVELNRMLDAHELTDVDEAGIELRKSIDTWGGQLADDLKVLVGVRDQAEERYQKFSTLTEVDLLAGTAESISICTLVQDECAKHVRRRTDILDQFSADVRNIKKRFGSK